MSYKSDIFTSELNTIINLNIRKFCVEMLDDAPDYFFVIPASSTGKFHPKFAQNEQGLIRHTKALVGIANDLLSLEQYNFDPDTKDMIRVAGILHDAKKLGDNGSQWTVFDHPIIAADWVRNSKSETVSQDVKNEIASMIASHMGSWNTSKHSETILPKPVTEEQKFVHMCDYLASRKHLEYVFACLDRTRSNMRNIRQYLRVALYNAPMTMYNSTAAEVRRDFGFSSFRRRPE